VKPGVELAAAVEEDVREAMSHEADIDVDKGINDMQPSAQEAPVTTPNFTNRQLYLNPAPVGVDAPYAWQFPGGRGAGVNVIDLEWGWQFTHEDLLVNQGGVLAGNNSPSNNHGTAVLGEISGDVNNYGIKSALMHALARCHLLRCRQREPFVSQQIGCNAATSCCSRCTVPAQDTTSRAAPISADTSRSNGGQMTSRPSVTR
jgi:hypothetical protein